MIQGKTLFNCDNCKNVFVGLDIELVAMDYSQPLVCPRCGCRHTKPLFESKRLYKEIWNRLDVNLTNQEQ